MSAHSIKLNLEDGSVIYITPRRARELQKRAMVSIVSAKPFQLKLRAGSGESETSSVQKWSTHSAGLVMHGAILTKRTPKP